MTMKIPINQLKTCPINSEIYRDSDVGDLVNSIGEVGLLQPIVVTPDNTIISGHRRFKAIQSLGWTEVEVEVKEVDDDSIPLYIVLFNQSRNKVASELIREIMVLMDSQWIGQGNWNRGKSDQMITFGNWRDKVSKDIGISQTKIQKLLYIYQNQPELIKYIDDDRMTIHSAWLETKRQMNTISLSEHRSNRNQNSPLLSKDFTLYLKSSESMDEVSDQSIDLIVTSPPYWKKRNYGVDGQIGLETSPNDYLNNLLKVFDECKRVLKDDGSMFIVIGDTFNSYGSLQNIPQRLSIELTDRGWLSRNWLVWHKTNPKPESVKTRWNTSCEFVLFFTKSQNYYFDIDSIRVPYKNKSKFSGSPRHHNLKHSFQIHQETMVHPLGKLPHDFLDDIIETSVSQESGDLKHGATFPEKLIEPLIKVGSMVGDTVLDPFCGTGTTGKVSLSNGRKSIGYEINPRFNEIIKQKMIDFCIDELSLTGS